jgi:hypothetical protein
MQLVFGIKEVMDGMHEVIAHNHRVASIPTLLALSKVHCTITGTAEAAAATGVIGRGAAHSAGRRPSVAALSGQQIDLRTNLALGDDAYLGDNHEDASEYMRRLLQFIHTEFGPQGLRQIAGYHLSQSLVCTREGCGAMKRIRNERAASKEVANLCAPFECMLDVPVTKEATLAASVADFFAVGSASDSTSVCPKCSQPGCMPKPGLASASGILFVTIKRFQCPTRSTRRKGSKQPMPSRIDTPVAVELRLKLTSFVDAAEGAPAPALEYDLIGFITHGNLSRRSRKSVEEGHFICYERRADDEWNEYDDDAVEQIDEAKALAFASKEGYIFAYRRRKG